jgi:crossover junction endodeoxyribonuclease RuvC
VTLILGIDPGKTGALALLHGTDLFDLEDMPDVTGAALGAAVADLIADLAPNEITAAWVEKVHAMPKQGVKSVWTFAEGYGAILGALGALRVPVRHVTPNEWKKAARLPKDKAAARQRACELWPAESSRFARVKDDGRAEAALIALHGARVMAGEGQGA